MTNLCLSVLLEAFENAQLLPLSTHATFFALRGFGGANLPLAAACGAAGGALGQMVNWAIGRGLLALRARGKVYLRDEVYETARRIFSRFFLPLLLFSWFGLGGILVVAAGFLRIRWWAALLWIMAGYAGWFGWWLYSA